LYLKEANGIGHEELLVKSPHGKAVSDWSRDGRFLVYLEIDPKTGMDIWVLPLEGDRKPFPFLKTEFNEGFGMLSPVTGNDGHSWMAYTSDETGRPEVYLRSFLPGAPGGPAGAKVRVSTGGGLYPMWRADGRELYFDRGGTLMAVDVKLGAAAEIGPEHRLFDLPPGHEVGYASFGDGQRFLFIEPVGEPPAAKINVVLNWQAELKR
jgi:Tol biopolymer transport system component